MPAVITTTMALDARPHKRPSSSSSSPSKSAAGAEALLGSSPGKKRKWNGTSGGVGEQTLFSSSASTTGTGLDTSSSEKVDLTTSLKTRQALDELLRNPVEFVKARRVTGSLLANGGDSSVLSAGPNGGLSYLSHIKNLVIVNGPDATGTQAKANGAAGTAESSSAAVPTANGHLTVRQAEKSQMANELDLPDLWPFPVSMRFPNAAQAATGLGNYGNSCYMNSVLQALLHTPPLADILLDRRKVAHLVGGGSDADSGVPFSSPILSGKANGGGGGGGKFDPLLALSRLAENALIRRQPPAGAPGGGGPRAGNGGGQNKSIYPRQFNDSLNSYAKGLRRGRQEDAHELLRLLLESLQARCLSTPEAVEAIRRFAPRTTPKSSPSKGMRHVGAAQQQQSGIAKKLSKEEEAADRAAQKARDEIKNSTFVNRIFGGRFRSRVVCTRCKHPSDTFDDFLDVSLDIAGKRGIDSVDSALQSFTKPDEISGSDKYRCEHCKRPVDALKQFTVDAVPPILTIQLKRFSFTGRKITRAIKFSERLDMGPFMSTPPKPGTSKRNGTIYELYAVIHHHGGGPNSGHYIASVRDAKGKWMRMDDEIVTRGHHLDQNDPSAYILFYRRDLGEFAPDAVGGSAAGKGASGSTNLLHSIVQRDRELQLKRKRTLEAEEQQKRRREDAEMEGKVMSGLPSSPPKTGSFVADAEAVRFFAGGKQKFNKPVDFDATPVRKARNGSDVATPSSAAGSATQGSASRKITSSGANKPPPRRIALNDSDEETESDDERVKAARNPPAAGKDGFSRQVEEDFGTAVVRRDDAAIDDADTDLFGSGSDSEDKSEPKDPPAKVNGKVKVKPGEEELVLASSFLNRKHGFHVRMKQR